jgi:hypothetical protein
VFLEPLFIFFNGTSDDEGDGPTIPTVDEGATLVGNVSCTVDAVAAF